MKTIGEILQLERALLNSSAHSSPSFLLNAWMAIDVEWIAAEEYLTLEHRADRERDLD